MKKIQLTNSIKKVSVDSKDFEKLKLLKWHLLNSGYAATSIKEKTVLMHRLILNIPFKKQTDHINKNKLDNRQFNLRICSRNQNARNKKIYKNNTSGYTGVYLFIKKNGWSKWKAKIYFNKKKIYLGYFKNKKEAAKIYNKAAIKYFGKFARLNLI